MSDQSFEEFLATEGVEPVAEGASVVTIRSTGGGVQDVAIDGPTSVREVLAKANLAMTPGVEYWVGGVAVAPEYSVGPGAIITAVANVKGGSL